MNLKKILVVDDEEEILKLVVKKLSAEGYLVQGTTKGKEAVQKAKTTHPNLILMDIVLPDIDGAEAVKQLNEDPLTRNIPVIFLSGIASKDRETGSKSSVNVGGKQYKAMAKPFNFDELLLEVRKTIP